MLSRWARFEACAESVANGNGWLLTSFMSLSQGGTGVDDIDFSGHGAHAWVVSVDPSLEVPSAGSACIFKARAAGSRGKQQLVVGLVARTR